MLKKRTVLLICMLSILLMIQNLKSQVPAEQRGHHRYRKAGIHNGNRVETEFFNYGQVAYYQHEYAGVWPKGTKQSYMDGITPFVAGEFIDIHGDTIHSVLSAYREGMDYSTITGLPWGWEPRPGYANPKTDKIAMSDDPESWPEYWPDKAEDSFDPGWFGFWNGYFGKRANADQESYFVMDDDADEEFDFYPDCRDSSRNGMGLRVAVRGFQWSNFLAEDLVFWHYEILNEGTVNYDDVIFGMYVDCGVGGWKNFESDDDNAYYDTNIDITYSWDNKGDGMTVDNVPFKTGYAGYGFLESPGNPWNGIDDDDDGVVDERRDDGIDNDGDWDVEKHDLGGDGVSGTGDPGEGDGVPTAGEPYFDATDLDESDQIGLTSFDRFYVGTVFPKDDEQFWQRVSYHWFNTSPLINKNIAFVYGSGTFPLKTGQTERFSMALVFGEELNDLILNKVTVEDIYAANYNFTRPPDKPEVHAVAGDGKITLYWDDRAEFSYDEFSDPPEDFEGYRIYKSSDPAFNESYTITDGYGSTSFYEPVAQFDKKDSIYGFFPIDFRGIKFYLGDDLGLRHSWTDYDVTNGQTYYYAVVSYDKGDAAKGLYPSECSKVIVKKITGEILTDINTVAVTSQAPAAGYHPPEVTGDVSADSENPIYAQHVGSGTGYAKIEVIDPTQIKDANYKIVFDDTSTIKETNYSLIDVTTPEQPDTLLINSTYIKDEDANPYFDGLKLTVWNDTDTAFVDSLSGWKNGRSNLQIAANPIGDGQYKYPAAMEIRIYDHLVDTSLIYLPRPVNFIIWNLADDEQIDFWFYDNDDDSLLTADDRLEVLNPLYRDERRYAFYKSWEIHFYPPAQGDTINPLPGEVGVVHITTPFRASDVFTFKTTKAYIDEHAAKDELSKIAVVPNPYVAAASWEPTRLYASGRGERMIQFIHLPAKATIRIYTIAGHLVKEITHDSPIENGAEKWDLTSKDGLDVAAGVYLYQVDALGVGKKLGRFAIIK